MVTKSQMYGNNRGALRSVETDTWLRNIYLRELEGAESLLLKDEGEAERYADAMMHYEWAESVRSGEMERCYCGVVYLDPAKADDHFDKVAERFATVQQAYDEHRASKVESLPDAEYGGDSYANIFWRGGYAGEPVLGDEDKEERIVLSSGAILYPGWYRNDRTFRVWFGNERNYTFVFAIERGNVIIRLWDNRKNRRNGTWRGYVQATYDAGHWQSAQSERNAMLWLMEHADRVAPWLNYGADRTVPAEVTRKP